MFIAVSMVLPALAARGQVSPPPAIADGNALLFIGNSYMGNYGGVNNLLQRQLASASPALKITTKSDIYYGQPLSAMFTPQAQELIQSKRFDPVIITSGTIEAMKQFDAVIRASGARTFVYQTWAGSHPGNRATMEAYRASTAADVRLMRQMERETRAVVVPVAVIYHDLISRPPREGLREDYLWKPANIHQNFLGTAVNAWSLYAVLTGRSPVGVDLDYTANLPNWMPPTLAPDDLALARDAELRRAVQERVWKVVQQWRSGTTEFDDLKTAQ